MKYKYILIIKIILLVLITPLVAQEVTADKLPCFNQGISTTPEFPAICSFNEGAEITCNEIAEIYEWRFVNNPKELSKTGSKKYIDTISFYGKTVIVDKPGSWLVTLKNANGCKASLMVEIYDFSSSEKVVEQLKKFGFFQLPIYRKISTPEGSQIIAADSNSCLIQPFSYIEDSNNSVDITEIGRDVLDNLDLPETLSSKVLYSNNECFCEKGLDYWQTQMNSSDVVIKVHTSFKDEKSTKGIISQLVKKPW